MNDLPPDTRGFRYWIQGYQNFYEPIVAAYFAVSGYEVVRRPAQVTKADIRRVTTALFDQSKRLGPDIDHRKLIEALEKRTRLQPDVLLRKDGQNYLAELKSWGGLGKGIFDRGTLRREFLERPVAGAFLLLDWLESCGPIHGKFLVVSSRAADCDAVTALLKDSFATDVEILYLDEMYRLPQLAGIIERQMRYLDAAVADLKIALQQEQQP